MKTHKRDIDKIVFAKIDRSIRKGGVTLEELRKQAAKAPGCLADCYLRERIDSDSDGAFYSEE